MSEESWLLSLAFPPRFLLLSKLKPPCSLSIREEDDDDMNSPWWIETRENLTTLRLLLLFLLSPLSICLPSIHPSLVPFIYYFSLSLASLLCESFFWLIIVCMMEERKILEYLITCELRLSLSLMLDVCPSTSGVYTLAVCRSVILFSHLSRDTLDYKAGGVM